MNHNRSTTSARRDDVLALLTDDERRSLAAAPAHRFAAGDEFLDLEKLDEGVRTAMGTGSPMIGLLPRSALHDATWAKVLTYLQSARSGAPASER